MARNGSGTMSITNTLTTGATITAAAHNTNYSDIATEITNSLPRDGQAAMTGQTKNANGTAALPSMTFGSDPDTGFYRSAANAMGVGIGGTQNAAMTINGIASPCPTGMIVPYVGTSVPTDGAGTNLWVRANGRTMGNASSGGTEEASSNTAGLFTLLWDNYSDSVCAVSSGRGASAAADYAANKTITLPDLRGRGFFGLDDMGNSAASRLGTVMTSETTNGSSGGTETHTITEGELAAHTHTGPSHTHTFSDTSTTESATHTHTGTVDSDGAHTHTVEYATSLRGDSGSLSVSEGPEASGGDSAAAAAISGGAHTHTFTSGNASATHTHDISGTTGASGTGASGSTGSDTAHSNMPPAWLGTFIIKL